MVVVASENGIDIHCDDAGKFSAYAYGQNFEDRSLNKVKQWTATVLPTVTLLQLEESSYGGGRNGMRVVDGVATVSADTNGAIYGLGPSKPNTRSRYDYTPSYRNLYEPDEAAVARMKALNERYAEWQKEIDQRYAAQFAEIKAILVPITVERFAEMKRAAVKEAKGDG